ncbi:MAG TPA: efflux RND transporter periplasmic adaptor subunit [candidate division Zixibacteria bacterium]|nr:efflux RND transporter periplasmic adaptor subunit [candidate division Zixibacteria bacterium]
MNKVKKFLIPALALTVGAALMVFFFGLREESPRRAAQPRSRSVESVIVVLGPVAAQISAFGRVTSAQPLELFSEVEGGLEAGDHPFLPAHRFSTGDVLLRVDDRQVDLDRRTAISDLLNALAGVLPEIKVNFPEQFDQWQSYIDQISFDKPIPELPEAANRRVKLYLSRFNVYKLYFRVRDLEIQQSKHVVRAQFDGAVVDADRRVGATVRPGTRLGSLVNLEDLEVELPLVVNDINWINFDEPVTFSASGLSGQWSGKIVRVGGAIDKQTQTVPLYVRLEDAPEETLLDGVFFTASATGRVIERALEIPRRALYEESYVYVVNNGALEYRQVTVDRLQQATAIISDGLSDGDTLVIEPLQGVAPGMLAAPRFREPAQESQ